MKAVGMRHLPVHVKAELVSCAVMKGISRGLALTAQQGELPGATETGGVCKPTAWVRNLHSAYRRIYNCGTWGKSGTVCWILGAKSRWCPVA